jgi:peptide deformylase
MGDPRLWQKARPVEQFNTPQLHALIADMEETMRHLDGAGLAAPQIGVDLRVVIFGVDGNPRYPDAEQVPRTVLINPVLTPLSPTIEEGWEGCLSVPGLRGWVPRWSQLLYRLRRFRSGRSTAASRFPRARGATRMRPPRRHSLSDADQGLQPLRFRRRAFSWWWRRCARIARLDLSSAECIFAEDTNRGRAIPDSLCLHGQYLSFTDRGSGDANDGAAAGPGGDAVARLGRYARSLPRWRSAGCACAPDRGQAGIRSLPIARTLGHRRRF